MKKTLLVLLGTLLGYANLYSGQIIKKNNKEYEAIRLNKKPPTGVLFLEGKRKELIGDDKDEKFVYYALLEEYCLNTKDSFCGNYRRDAERFIDLLKYGTYEVVVEVRTCSGSDCKNVTSAYWKIGDYWFKKLPSKEVPHPKGYFCKDSEFPKKLVGDLLSVVGNKIYLRYWSIRKTVEGKGKYGRYNPIVEERPFSEYSTEEYRKFVENLATSIEFISKNKTFKK